MSAPTGSQWEESKRCPICDRPGEEVATNLPGHKITNQPDRAGGKVYTFKCITEMCRWFDTTWIVQVRADGTIPMRAPGDKQFAPISKAIETMAENEMEDLRRRGLV